MTDRGRARSALLHLPCVLPPSTSQEPNLLPFWRLERTFTFISSTACHKRGIRIQADVWLKRQRCNGSRHTTSRSGVSEPRMGGRCCLMSTEHGNVGRPWSRRCAAAESVRTERQPSV